MQAIEYKGFNIYHLNSGRFAAQNKGDASFNPNGYATLNNAKGAITKHIKAQEVLHNAIWDDVCAMAKADEDFSDMGYGNNMHIKITPQVALTKHMSRNQREGRFVGCTDGRPLRMHMSEYNKMFVYSEKMFPRNRKQRKLLDIRNKNLANIVVQF